MQIVALIPKQTTTKKTIKNNVLCVMCHMPHVRFQVSHITYLVSHVACHLSLSPTATARDPPSANSPLKHSRLVCKDQKKTKIAKVKIIVTAKRRRQEAVNRYANNSNMLFNQKCHSSSVQHRGKEGCRMSEKC